MLLLFRAFGDRRGMDVIVFSIPFFFLLIGAELAYAARTRRRLFRLNDSVTDLSCGVISQLSGVFSRLFAMGIRRAASACSATARRT
jgi:hypothetical protein